MRRLRRALPVLVAIVATWSVTSASAQAKLPAWVYVQDSSGQIWMTGPNNVRAAIPLHPATDEEIASFTWAGLWLVPKPDGTGLEPGPKPDWATGGAAAAVPAPAPQAAPAPPPAEDVVKLSGDTGQNTRPFDLRGGNYTVKWHTELRRDSSSCFSGATLYRVDGKQHVESLFSVTLQRSNGDRSADGETQVYGVKPGQHYLDVTTTACSWSVEIRPQ